LTLPIAVPGPWHASWPAAAQLALSLAFGLSLGLERRAAGKVVGVRTFGGIALVSTLAWQLDPADAYVLFALLVPVVAALNVRSLWIDRSLELTTSVVMLSTALLGMLVGAGQASAAAGCGLLVVGLLAAKAKLGRFANTVTLGEIRAALIVGMTIFVVSPLVPGAGIGPGARLDLRTVWAAALAASALALTGYVLLRRRPGVPLG